MQWHDDTPHNMRRVWRSDDGRWKLERDDSGRYWVQDADSVACGIGATPYAAVADWEARAHGRITYLRSMIGNIHSDVFGVPEDVS